MRSHTTEGEGDVLEWDSSTPTEEKVKQGVRTAMKFINTNLLDIISLPTLVVSRTKHKIRVQSLNTESSISVLLVMK